MRTVTREKDRTPPPQNILSYIDRATVDTACYLSLVIITVVMSRTVVPHLLLFGFAYNVLKSCSPFYCCDAEKRGAS